MLVFFVILIVICLIIYLSGINLEVGNFEIEKNKHIQLKDLEVNMYLLIFNKIKILKFSINKEQIQRINFNKILKRFKGKTIKQDKNIIIKNLNLLKIEVKKIKIKSQIGLKNVTILAYLVAILNIILSIIYTKIANSYKQNYKYIIHPYQTNSFFLKLSINCIINIKIANIINMIIKNRSEVKNERTSNRSFNGNSNEQYSRYGGRKHYYRSTN